METGPQNSKKPKNITELKKEAISIDELRSLHENYVNKEEEICDKHETMLDFIEDEGNERTLNIIKDINKNAQLFLNELLRSKDRFFRVFKTEHGSYYFSIASGEVFRIKFKRFKNIPGFYQLHPIMKNIFFLPQAESDRILKEGNLAENINKPINLSDYVNGAVPFEINKYESSVLSDYILEDNVLLVGKPSLPKYKAPSSHIGHPIVEILK